MDLTTAHRRSCFRPAAARATGRWPIGVSPRRRRRSASRSRSSRPRICSARISKSRNRDSIATGYDACTTARTIRWRDATRLPTSAFPASPRSKRTAAARDDLRRSMEATRRLQKSRPIMPLSFPNRSRSYDSTRRAVRFWGHDSAMEASFFVTEDALKRVQPDMRFDEPGLLGAFDANRDRIYAAAAKVYARGRRGSYDVVDGDF